MKQCDNRPPPTRNATWQPLLMPKASQGTDPPLAAGKGSHIKVLIDLRFGPSSGKQINNHGSRLSCCTFCELLFELGRK